MIISTGVFCLFSKIFYFYFLCINNIKTNVGINISIIKLHTSISRQSLLQMPTQVYFVFTKPTEPTCNYAQHTLVMAFWKKKGEYIQVLMTCNFLLAQYLMFSKQFCLTNFTHKTWVNLWCIFRYFPMVLHIGTSSPGNYQVTFLRSWPERQKDLGQMIKMLVF